MMTFFEICFWVGVAVTALNAVLGLLFGIIDFGVDFDFDLDIGDFDLGLVLPLSPSLFFLFLIVFGGMGRIFYDTYEDKLWLILLIAIGTGLAVTSLINILILRPLRRISKIETGANDDFVGMTGTVSEKIFKDSYGKVAVIYDGNIITAPAKAADGGEIPAGTVIIVESVVKTVFVVSIKKRDVSDALAVQTARS